MLVDLTDDQANTLDVLSTAKVNVINTLANIQGLLQPTQVYKTPAKIMQTKTYRELEDVFGAAPGGQTSADSGFGGFSGDDLDAMFGGSSLPAQSFTRKAAGKTYAEIDATTCFGDPYPRTPKRFRQPTSKPAPPSLIDIGTPDWKQWSRQRTATPVQQKSPVRARSSPRVDIYESPDACAYRPQSAPKSAVSLSPRTPIIQYQSSTPRSPSSARRVLQMPEAVAIYDDEESDDKFEDVACSAPEPTLDLDDFNAFIKEQVDKMKTKIDHQNALKRRMEVETLRKQDEAEYWDSYY